MAITATQAVIDEIKSAVGHPLITTLDYSAGTDDFIKTYVISRVLRKYFTYFPIITDSNHSVSGNFEIDYPTTAVYKVLRNFFNYKNINYATYSPFVLQTMIMGRTPPMQGFNHRYLNEAINRLSVEEGIVDYTKAIRFDDRPHDRKVYGFTNMSGDITIEWANKSEDFGTILYMYEEDAIKLSKAYFIFNIFRLREQVKISSKIEINTAALKEDATRWEEEVIKKWTAKGFAVLVKT